MGYRFHRISDDHHYTCTVPVLTFSLNNVTKIRCVLCHMEIAGSLAG